MAMINPLLEFLAREHPALVHVPLGLVVCLPLMVAVSLRSREPGTWRRMTFRAGLVALGLSLVTSFSGLLWARLLSLIPAGALLPQVASQGQALQRTLRAHEGAAAAGFVLGCLCLLLLRKSYRQPGHKGWTALCLTGTLAWAGAWGYTGKLGGIMVFGNAATNKAAADLINAKKNDAEADLPIRALDYASLEPAQEAPFLSRGHDGRMARTWVTASGIDAFQARKPLPVGAYAVMSTSGAKGEPGPLYMREVKADGTQAFAFYWPRVPEAARRDTAGEDFVYWRSPAKGVAGCVHCHETAGPAAHGPAGR